MQRLAVIETRKDDVGFERLDLAAECIATDGDIQSAKRLLSGGASTIRSANMIIPAHEPSTGRPRLIRSRSGS